MLTIVHSNITCSINISWNESVFSPKIISELLCSKNNEASLDLRMMFRYFLILVFESLQSTMGIFLIYDIEVQIVYLTYGKTKSNCLNGGPLGSVSFSWEFPSFHWEFQWLTDWLRKSYLLICVISHIHRSHGEAVIVAAYVVCCVCVCVLYTRRWGQPCLNQLYHHILVLPVLELYINGNIQYSCVYVFFWLNIMLMSFLLLHELIAYFHVVYYFIVWITLKLYICCWWVFR